MKTEIKYVHTNLIAKDWRKLAQFYIDILDCEPVLPERDLSGEWIDKITQIKDVSIKGIHLRLPGYDANGPTLEIFEYNKEPDWQDAPNINDYGFGHLAFHVTDVEAIMENIIDYGGSAYGDLIERDFSEIGILKAVYARDPEGNIIEIQNWKKK